MASVMHVDAHCSLYAGSTCGTTCYLHRDCSSQQRFYGTGHSGLWSCDWVQREWLSMWTWSVIMLLVDGWVAWGGLPPKRPPIPAWGHPCRSSLCCGEFSGGGEGGSCSRTTWACGRCELVCVHVYRQVGFVWCVGGAGGRGQATAAPLGRGVQLWKRCGDWVAMLWLVGPDVSPPERHYICRHSPQGR